MELTILEKEKGQFVSARELYMFLEVKSHFKDWISRRIVKYGFVENEDFILVAQKRATNNPKNPTTIENEYLLTVDMAKELSMIENNMNGRTARKYFIECEKRYIQLLKNKLELYKNKDDKNLLNSHEFEILLGSNKTISYLERQIAEDLETIRNSIGRLDDHRKHVRIYSEQISNMAENMKNKVKVVK